MSKVIYNPETGSIEDYAQCVAIIVPDDIEFDELGAILGNPDRWDTFTTQNIVTWEDTLDAFLLAMKAEGLDHNTRSRIVATVHDALDNND
jgi:hypothetical protein